MKHTTLDFGEGTPLCFISFPKYPFPISNKKAKDAFQNKLYLKTTIEYVVKHDPKKEKFVIPAVGIGYFLQEDAEKGIGKLKTFNVYLDLGVVMERVRDVLAGAGEREA